MRAWRVDRHETCMHVVCDGFDRGEYLSRQREMLDSLRVSESKTHTHVRLFSFASSVSTDLTQSRRVHEPRGTDRPPSGAVVDDVCLFSPATFANLSGHMFPREPLTYNIRFISFPMLCHWQRRPHIDGRKAKVAQGTRTTAHYALQKQRLDQAFPIVPPRIF